MAMGAAVQEVIYLRALMKDFGYPIKDPTYIQEKIISHVSRCATILLCPGDRNSFYNSFYNSLEVAIHYTPTEDMTADI